MNIFVIATTLQAGGGITIYKQFLSHLPEFIGENKYWIFINPVLPKVDIKGVTYISFPLQSKIKRILFEGRWLKNYAKKNGISPDVVVSLQNNGYKCFDDCKHIVYYHQALPLYPGMYSLFKKSERIFFNYKYIFPILVKRTWKKNTQFVVQTKVVKERFSSFFGISKDKIHVCFPDIEEIDPSLYKPYSWGDNKKHLIYVGDDCKYRNGAVLIEAMIVLKTRNPKLAELIKIHITSTPEKSPIMNELMIQKGVSSYFMFEGVVDHEKLLEYYKASSALVIPSSIETVGLPMLEAAVFGIPILAADMDFAHEVLKGYTGVKFISIQDTMKWVKELENVCMVQNFFSPLKRNVNSDWNIFFSLVK